MQMWTRDCVGIIGLDCQSTLVVVSECARHNRKPTCCPWCVVCVGVGQIVCMQTSWAWRHSYKHLNYSDFTVAYNVSGGHNSTEGLLSRFCIFVASPTRHTYNRQCLHSHTRTCACVQPEHNPECACRVAHVYSKPDRHAFEAPRHVPAPTPLAHSCEACAGRCAMGL